MKLQTLKPRLLAKPAARITTLEPKAGTTPRQRGRVWMVTRERILLAHNYLCLYCRAQGIRTIANQVDHRIPLEQGGPDVDSNLQPLCKDCHDAKTASEAKQRAGGV